MVISNNPSDNRIVFFDNLRYLLVLFVVLMHSGNAYSNLIRWWPVADNSTSHIVDYLGILFDAITMPLLFFIAGYFAIPNIQNKDIGIFLKGKFIRLGIPWLICILFVCPVFPFIYHFTRNNFTLTTNYWDFWLLLLNKSAEFNISIIDSMDLLMENNQFHQRYMWYLSLLLLFFIAFSILFKLKHNWFSINRNTQLFAKPSVLKNLKLLFSVGCISILLSFLSIKIMFFLSPHTTNPEARLTIFNIIQIEPSRLFVYIIYFSMGIIAYKRKWIEKGIFPGHFKTWLIAFTILLIGYLYFVTIYLIASIHSKELLGSIVFIIRNLFIMASLGLFTSIALVYWNRPSQFNSLLASNSYNIYLSHYIFVLLFQLLLFTFAIPGIIKFGIVSIFSSLCAYIISHFLIGPFPKISIVISFIVFILMALLIHT